MKTQRFSKQACALVVGIAGALAPFGSVQAADELADRYLNGYLHDPYTSESEMPVGRASVFPPGVSSIDTADARGAEGPIRDDAGMRPESFRSDQPLELYMGYTGEDAGSARGAEGPIRSSPADMDGGPTKPVERLPDHQFGELYDPPVTTGE